MTDKPKDAMTETERQMRNALGCLYIAVEPSVARDVGEAVNAHVAELRAALASLEKIRLSELKWIANHNCRDEGHASPLDCRSEIRAYANGRMRADLAAEQTRHLTAPGDGGVA